MLNYEPGTNTQSMETCYPNSAPHFFLMRVPSTVWVTCFHSPSNKFPFTEFRVFIVFIAFIVLKSMSAICEHN